MNKWWIAGGVGAVILVGYVATRPSSGGAGNNVQQQGDLTYVGPGIPNVVTQGTVQTDAGLQELNGRNYDLQNSALTKQSNLISSDQLTQGILDMYNAVIPAVNVQRGFTQNFTAGVDYTSSGAVVSFNGAVTPVAPQQDLVDQISFLTNKNTDLSNRINLLGDQNTALTSTSASLQSGKSLADQERDASNARALSAEAKVSQLTQWLRNIAGGLQQAQQSGITGQKTPSGASKNMLTSGLSNIAANLQAALAA